jgi:hypothetical protein
MYIITLYNIVDSSLNRRASRGDVRGAIGRRIKETNDKELYLNICARVTCVPPVSPDDCSLVVHFQLLLL